MKKGGLSQSLHMWKCPDNPQIIKDYGQTKKNKSQHSMEDCSLSAPKQWAKFPRLEQ